MTLFRTRVMAQTLALTTSLGARLVCIFALPWPMAVFLTEMRAALERRTAYLTTTSVCEPTRYIFHYPFSTKTLLVCKEWTFGTSFIIGMAIMCRLRMTTRLWPLTGTRAWRGLRATWQRRIQNRSSTVARDFIKNCLSACVAWALVAELRAGMSSAFQHSTAYPRANVFSFNFLLGRTKMRLEFPAGSLTLNRHLLSRAASFSACMSSAMQSCLALPEALRRIKAALMTDTHRSVAATLA